MGDLNKGTTFVDGSTEVDAAGLHSLVEDATLTVSAITGKTAMTTLANEDRLLIHDYSESALRSVTYDVIKTAIAAATTPASVRKAVVQANSFAIGDVVRFNPAGTLYEKATAKFASVTFATGDVNAGTDRITLPTNTLVNSEPILFGSSGTLPAPLVSGVRYYAKKIDATTLEVYEDSGLATIIAITDVGSGTHTVYNELERAIALGIVSSAPDSSNFTVVFSGEVTGLSGFTAGKAYYLSGSTAGALTATPPTTYGQTVQPVLVATSTSAGIVVSSVASPLAAESVRSEHIANEAVGRTELSSDIVSLLDRNIGSDRQTVLHGAKDANGVADFLVPGTGLQVVLEASVSEPCIISFANGFDDVNGYNFVEKLIANQNFDSLPASTECFLYVDRSSVGALTYSYSLMTPEHGYSKTQYRNRHAFPRQYSSTGTNGVTIVASSQDATNQAYRAFNGERATYWQTGVTGVCDIRHQYTYKKAVNSYSIRCNDSASGAPTAWVFAGSNDGTTFTTLDSRSSITFSGTNAINTYTCANATAYAYYKLSISANNGGAVKVEVSELVLHEAIDHYYVIPEGTMYYWDGATWAAKTRVFVGEVRTGASTVSAGSTTAGLFTYAIRGIYASPLTAITSNSCYPLASAIGHPIVSLDLFSREDSNYTFNRASFITGTYTLIRPEIGYLLDDSQTSTNTLGGDPRLERLYSSIVAPGTYVTSDAASLTSNGAGETTFAEAYIVARRLF